MIQAFSHIFNFFNKASPCGDMLTLYLVQHFAIVFGLVSEADTVLMVGDYVC
jgi:hypothetical protein